ncbi:predicted protein [Lichtheimia corymbifera JMRC:FSU:9682]|uniref:Uncharacterized protein n=1 Tax=Lichtheimia corymbifera JMRC:FSU:9682 TaxID=1263082 RepID=A0A068RSV2_9FUNG|nr:predicted protein [Lichtheimia corymbifera JMRC:FSU:9682]
MGILTYCVVTAVGLVASTSVVGVPPLLKRLFEWTPFPPPPSCPALTQQQHNEIGYDDDDDDDDDGVSAIWVPYRIYD